MQGDRADVGALEIKINKAIDSSPDLRDKKELINQFIESLKMLGYEDLSINTKVAKVSIVGAGMASATGVASKMFEALAMAGINIRMISTSEIRVTVLISEKDGVRAMNAVHDAFNLAD